MSVNPAKPTPLEDKFILTSEEAAEFLGVSLRTIRYWVATRRIPYFHLGRFIRFKPADLTAFLESGRVDPLSTDGPCRASATHAPGGGSAEWPLRSGNESHVTTNIWDDSAAPLGPLACQIHRSQRSTEGRPADLHYEGRGGTLAVSDSVRDGTGAVCRSQGRQRIAVGLRDIVAVHTAGPWTTAIASHA
jgi:excisionase family DNA binding protein